MFSLKLCSELLLHLNLFLLCGVALRHFFKKLSSMVPYTVLLMLIGVVLGVVIGVVVVVRTLHIF